MLHRVRKIQAHPVYGLLIILLALLSAALLIFEVSDVYADQVLFMRQIDLSIAIFFLADFTVGILAADNKKQYFKHNWLDLLAAIPLTGGTFQTLRILRVIRVVARIWRISDFAEHLVMGSAKYIYAMTIVVVIILSNSIAFYTFEYGVNPHVHNFFDAVWWTFTTVASVGYGDIVPVTVEGRIVGMILMVFGVCIVGSVAGLVGSHFLHKKLELRVEKEVKKAEKEIEEKIEEDIEEATQ